MDYKQALKDKIRDNLEIFARVTCSHIFKQKTPDFHKDMYGKLQDNTDRLCFIVFRGGAKSTLGVTLNVLWRVVTDREKYIWIIAEGTRQAAERLHDITYELQNNAILHELYGKFIFEKDSEREVIIVNPETGHRLKIAALGSRQRMRGGLFEGNRLTLVILDDFESETNTETSDLRDKLVRWLYATMRPVFDPKDGRILMLGTIVHPDAYLQSIRENPGDWQVVEYPIERDGSRDGTKPTWPERFSTKFIQRERKDYHARGRLSLFYQEYYNEPVAEEEKPFKESLLKYYNGTFDRQYGAITFDDGEKKTVNVTIGVDVAMGKKKGDFSAMSAVGQTEDGKVYLLRTFNKRVQPYELIHEIFRWNVDFSSPFGKPRFVIETVAMQELLISWIKEEERKRNSYILKTEVRHRQGKDGENSRFLMLQPMHEAGILYFKRNGHEELLNQLLRWGPNIELTNDDLLDSYQMAATHVKICKRQLMTKDRWKEERDYKTFNWAVM